MKNILSYLSDKKSSFIKRGKYNLSSVKKKLLDKNNSNSKFSGFEYKNQRIDSCYGIVML